MAPPPPSAYLLAATLPLLLLTVAVTAASSRLSIGQTLTPDNGSLVSSEGTFALGFFPNSTGNPYLGIWYNNVASKRVVWVANRDSPIRSSPGNLTISANSTLVLSDSLGAVVWSSTATAPASSSAGANAVLVGANLVLRSGDNSILWQSFDYPTDAILSGTKLWANRATRTAERISSWRSPQDPSSGNFSFGMDPENPFQFVIFQGMDKHWRSDVWEGASYNGINMGNYVVFLKFEHDGTWSNTTFSYSDTSAVLNLMLSPAGRLELQEWKQHSGNWSVAYYLPMNSCQEYGRCGVFGFCDESADSPTCLCLDRFVPKNKTDWKAGRFGGGCVRMEQLRCEDGGDDFVAFGDMKMPDRLVSLGDLDLNDCLDACRRNCSCVAYAHPNNSTSCVIWVDELIDMGRQGGSAHEESLYVRGQTLYVRVASTGTGGKTKIAIVVISILVAMLFMGLTCIIWRRRKHSRSRGSADGHANNREEIAEENVLHDGERKLDLPLLDFDELLAATDNFSDSHKIGQGGFGKVYKGKMLGGEEVAIKRLSRGSGQGLEEFKNEVVVIAQLQHRNLVRLLGCCIKGAEKLLIYEYMPNKSLDFFLFGDLENQIMLSWERRFIIIKGIARGLRYLHEDSRLRIIHRDLKASNVLLDGDMNPRISDFGMARIFGGDQNQANTVRVAGTYGYMSPEYAMEGIFSVKSDVYSFGVLLLEIISGRRNTGFRSNADHYSLVCYAWESWNNGTPMDIVDPVIGDFCSGPEVARCVHIGLLCVQDRTKDRPTMSSVVFMLENDGTIQKTPEKPTFTPRVKHAESSEQGRTTDTGSLNSVTLTAVQCR